MQVSGDARLDQEHVLEERAEVRIDGIEPEHRPHPRLEGRVAQPWLRRAGIGIAQLHGRDPHAVVVGVDQSRQDELAAAADDLRARVQAAERRTVADLGNRAVTYEHGALRQRDGVGRGQQDVAADEELGHAAHAIRTAKWHSRRVPLGR